MSQRRQTPSPILVVGAPRLGKSWVARIIASHPSVGYFHEPDNEKLHPVAFYLKQRLHRFPYLRAADDAPEFEMLWKLALYGRLPGRRVRKAVDRVGRLAPEVVERNIQARCDANVTSSGRDDIRLSRWQRRRAAAAYAAARGMATMIGTMPQRRLVKSVHSVLALRWIARNFAVPTVVVRRDPFAVVASYLRMKLPDADRNVFSQTSFVEDFLDTEMAETVTRAVDPLQRIGYQLAAIDRFLDSYVRGNPDCITVEHEALCRDPVAEFRAVFDRLGLPWAAEIERAIETSNRAGTGFNTQRARHEEIGKWKRELRGKQVRLLSESFATMRLQLGNTGAPATPTDRQR